MLAVISPVCLHLQKLGLSFEIFLLQILFKKDFRESNPRQLKQQWPKNVNIYDCQEKKTPLKLQMRMLQLWTKNLVDNMDFKSVKSILFLPLRFM